MQSRDGISIITRLWCVWWLLARHDLWKWHCRVSNSTMSNLCRWMIPMESAWGFISDIFPSIHDLYTQGCCYLTRDCTSANIWQRIARQIQHCAKLYASLYRDSRYPCHGLRHGASGVFVLVVAVDIRAMTLTMLFVLVADGMSTIYDIDIPRWNSGSAADLCIPYASVCIG